ncbi:hypothetical protein BGC31_13825 [Komagataeibacter xylinus]|nr:hypothetical protein H845_1383 [Komagataeibacter xylinus E25]RFO99145.1 hypothetical protein BFX83_00990 [Komagataeibacter xylinus]RFP00689.1 hypothetical protein BGC31_13825 [Komagataeibacter xylinus]
MQIHNRPVWHQFCLVFPATAGVVGGCLYLFVVPVDPWGGLPLSLPLHRLPLTSNARFTMPMLARRTGSDSVIPAGYDMTYHLVSASTGHPA